jgi:hypothetical protein
MSDSPITVRVDDRIRLLSAVLAMTTWPEQEQDRQPHGVHAHARMTRAHLTEDEYHPAVLSMQELLEASLPLDTIFSFASYLNWPGVRARGGVPKWASKEWPAQIRDFLHRTRLRNLWEEETGIWNRAVEESGKALADCNPLDLLSKFFGPLPVELVFQPNLCYPTDQSVGFRWDKSIVAISPPRIAWGNNPPWPYDDDIPATCQDAFGVYARVLLREYLKGHPEPVEQAQRIRLPVPNVFRAQNPDWNDQFSVIFISGATAIFLEQTFGEAESKAYVMMTHKAHNFTVLPSVINVLRHYLAEHERGKYGSFAEFIPTFCKGLRVTEQLKKL